MREPRLGDDIDDFCVRCKRIMNHAVVSVINAAPAKVRCRTCHSDHDYRHEQAPPPKVDSRKAALFNEVLKKVSPGEAPVPLDPPGEASEMADPLDEAAVDSLGAEASDAEPLEPEPLEPEPLEPEPLAAAPAEAAPAPKSKPKAKAKGKGRK